MKNKELGKSLLLLLAIILISTLLARSLTRHSETLEDNAKKYSTDIEQVENDDSDIGPKITVDEQDSAALAGSSVPGRMVYQDHFYYEPINDDILKRIWGISYPEDCTVLLDDLVYASVLHYNFEGSISTGEFICHKDIAKDLVEIFYELYNAEYQIEKMVLIDEYAGDDTASMEDNNTSCFNYRVVDGTHTLSQHAFGRAIDINPKYNPYIKYNSDGSLYISPSNGQQYANRQDNFPYKIDENDLCYRLFMEHGFTWGGNWNSVKDYQHFQKKDDSN